MKILHRINKFEKLGLGLFVHWGLYSKLSRGEWAQNILDVPNYEEAFLEFKPYKENIKKLVASAKKEGFKYIVLTTKHHDGFYLFDTKGISHFDSVHTPFGEDVVKIFVDECKKNNILPFLYFATYDWKNNKYYKDFPAYLEELRELVSILCTNYGEIGGLWFDGNWDKPRADWRESTLYNQIRQQQPEAIIVNNTGLEKQGIIGNNAVDVITFERGNPSEISHKKRNKYLAAEASITLNKHWGVAENDIDFVSPKQLIDQICNSRKSGANLLINTGLEFDGSIPAYSSSLLELVGKWMNIYGESIYNSNNFYHPTYKAENNCSDFIKGDYLFVYDLGNIGNSNVILGGEKSKEICIAEYKKKKIKKIVWLDNGKSLIFKQNLKEDKLTIYADGFEYGTHFIDRVAKISFW